MAKFFGLLLISLVLHAVVLAPQFVADFEVKKFKTKVSIETVEITSPPKESYVKKFSKKSKQPKKRNKKDQTKRIDPYLSAVLSKINNLKTYPTKAKILKQEGQIAVLIVIGRAGELKEMRMIKKSPHEILNKNTRNLFNQIQKFDPLPEKFHPELEITIPIIYQLSKR